MAKFMLIGGTLKLVTFLGTLSWASGSTISGSIDIGAAHPNKEIFLVSSVRGAAARTLTAASTTVDGIAVTKATTESQFFSRNTVSCAFAAVPSGSGSVTVTATYSGNLELGIVDVYSVIGRTNAGSDQTDTSQSSAASGATSATVNATTINAGGIWFGAHLHSNGNATTSPASAGGDVAFGAFRVSTAYRDFEASSSTPSDVWSWTTSAGHNTISWSFD